MGKLTNEFVEECLDRQDGDVPQLILAIAAARKRLEKQRPSLVAARDQAIVELRREKLQKETAEKAHKVARVRSR
jgi:hypothetical protein